MPITTKQRNALDDADFAGPDRSFPIRNQADVDAAAHLIGKAANPAAVKTRIKAIAKRKGLKIPDAWQTDSSSTADEPTQSGVHVDAPMGGKGKRKPFAKMQTFLTKLAELLRPKVDASEFAVAVRTARGHAGGTATATRRSEAATAGEPMVFYWDTADIPAMMPPDDDDDDDDTPRLEKADPRVNYRPAVKVGQQCAACSFYDADEDDPYPQCRIVEGYIAPLAVCDLFNPCAGGMAGSDDGGGSEPVDTSAAATEPLAAAEPVAAIEPPAWIPYLPVPGTYQHAVYGDIALTPDRIGRFVDQFKAGVYQSRLPLDAEHQTKLSGATGWITDMRRNADGSADAAVEWTDRGAAMLRADRFGFVSPEWFESWTDPATGTVYHDIAIGGALTTRPFFKDKALRPLAATEAVGVALDLAPRSAQEEIMPESTAPAGTGESQAFQERITQLEAERDAAMKLTEATAEVAKQATERVAALELTGREQRFTAEVRGKSDDNNLPWFGEVEKHVSMLEKLATTFGEDSDEFKHYVAMNRQHAELVKTSKAFQEIGTTGVDTSVGATGQIAAKVSALRAAEPTLTEAVAWERVLRAEPQLYSEYRAEQAPKGR